MKIVFIAALLLTGCLLEVTREHKECHTYTIGGKTSDSSQVDSTRCDGPYKVETK